MSINILQTEKAHSKYTTLGKVTIKKDTLKAMPKKMKPEVLEWTKELFEEYRKGDYSVRKLAKKNGLPFSTLRDRFRSVYGIDYCQHRSAEGTTYQIVLEHIKALPRGRKKEECKKWLEDNREKLLKLAFQEQTSEEDPRLFTEKRLDRESIAYCRFKEDLASSPFLGGSEYAPYLEENGERFYLHD